MVVGMKLDSVVPSHSALEQQYWLNNINFFRPTQACNTYLQEHLDHVSAKSTVRLDIYICFTFYSGNKSEYLLLIVSSQVGYLQVCIV